MQKDNHSKGVFSWPESVIDFLNPENHPPFPLVEIPESLNPFRTDGVRIFAKLLSMTPLANVKSLAAYSMLENAKRRNELHDTKRIIESSSGNTVLSLALIGRALGIHKTTAYISKETSPKKLALLRFLGVDVSVFSDPICPNPNDPESSIRRAQADGAIKGNINPGQYHNPDNPSIHERLTGPQIWDQTEWKMTVFCAGLGTTGTSVGTVSYLRSVNPTIRSVGVVRAPNNPIPGPRTRTLLNEIAFEWQWATDDIQTVGTIEAYRKSMELSRAGILAGPSSGFALAGLLKSLQQSKDRNGLDSLRNADNEIVCVFIVCDLPFVYLDEYLERLPLEEFPEIVGEHLLEYPEKAPVVDSVRSFKCSLSIDTALMTLYGISLSPTTQDADQIRPKSGVEIIDLRTQEMFEHFHLPGSSNFRFDDIIEHIHEFGEAWKDSTVVFVCEFGGKSHTLAHTFQAHGIRALSLEGGTVEWSKRNYPRILHSDCKISNTSISG